MGGYIGWSHFDDLVFSGHWPLVSLLSAMPAHGSRQTNGALAGYGDQIPTKVMP